MVGRLIGMILLAVLSSPAAAQSSPTAAPWVGVWQGTVGAAPVQVCFNGENFDDGAYYYKRHMTTIRLEPKQGEPGVWLERIGYDERAESAVPTWTNIAVQGRQLTARWVGNGKTLPITLTRVEMPVNDDGAFACGSMAYQSPRIVPTQYTTERRRLGRFTYTQLTAQVPKYWGEVELVTFRLDRAMPAINRINAVLTKEITAPPADAAYIDCVIGADHRSGMGGDYHSFTSPELISRNWLVTSVAIEYYCGGAHPDNYIAWQVWDLRTGEQQDVWTWMTAAAVRIRRADEYTDYAIQPALRRLLNGAIKPSGDKAYDAECGPTIREADTWSVRLDRRGFIFSPDLPHVIQACEDDLRLSYAQMAPLLNAEGRRRVADFRADVR